jgi:hypothetical protein
MISMFLFLHTQKIGPSLGRCRGTFVAVPMAMLASSDWTNPGKPWDRTGTAWFLRSHFRGSQKFIEIQYFPDGIVDDDDDDDQPFYLFGGCCKTMASTSPVNFAAAQPWLCASRRVTWKMCWNELARSCQVALPTHPKNEMIMRKTEGQGDPCPKNDPKSASKKWHRKRAGQADNLCNHRCYMHPRCLTWARAWAWYKWWPGTNFTTKSLGYNIYIVYIYVYIDIYL